MSEPRVPQTTSFSAEPMEKMQSQWVGTSAEHCQKMIDFAKNRSPMVKFMIDKLDEAGCAVSKNFIRVERCDMEVGGGFRATEGVIICHNHLASQEEVNHALTHELIHAYDHCRAKNIDWCDCEHHACSEIRAASLSGDCNYKMEVLRGHFGIQGQHQKCVKRRAELSVSMNPYCSKPGQAQRAVDKVFDACFADTSPFDRRP